MMEKSLVEGEYSMKRLFGLIILILVVFVIYFDLSIGTLPIAVETTTSAKSEISENEDEEINIDYFERKIASGDTVLSIIENHLDSAIPVPIQQVVTDFHILNSGVDAEKIQIGKTYKFPDYRVITDDSSN